MKYLKSKRYNPLYSQSILNHLERHVREISEPMDIVKISANLTAGQNHNLNRALSALLKFYELKGVSEDFLNSLRKAVPKDDVGVDLKVPSEDAILTSMRRLSAIPMRHQALYNLLLDSGLRLTEALKAIREFSEPTKVNEFYRLTLGYFRASKLAYAAYFSECTLNQIRAIQEEIKEDGARRYLNKYGFVTPKYLRKFAFDNMITLGIPESVADFIQGRTPKRIGAKHYMSLVRQADGFYQRYAAYLEGLRSNSVAKDNVKICILGRTFNLSQDY